MKKLVKIAAIALVIVSCLAALLTGCSETLTVEEGREMLVRGLEKAAESDTYYIKFRYNDNSSTNGKYTQYGLNVQGETAKFTIEEGDMLKTVYDDTYYGRSLKDGVDSKNATDADYVTGRIFWENDGWKAEECSLGDFLTGDKVAGYNMDGALALLDGLTQDELKITSVTRTGKVVYISAKVEKEGNELSGYGDLVIRLINDKLAYIGDTKETFYVSISYGGPVIKVPAWKTVTSKE